MSNDENSFKQSIQAFCMVNMLIGIHVFLMFLMLVLLAKSYLDYKKLKISYNELKKEKIVECPQKKPPLSK